MALLKGLPNDLMSRLNLLPPLGLYHRNARPAVRIITGVCHFTKDKRKAEETASRALEVTMEVTISRILRMEKYA